MPSFGMSFMVAYLLAPAPIVPQGLVSLSPMGGDTEGRPLSVLSSTRYGGSGGSACSFHPDSSSSPAPLRSTRLVNHLSHPPASWGDAHCCPDPEPCEQVFNRTPSYGSGHAPSYGSPRLVPSSDSTTTRQKFSSLSILSNKISSREREEAMYLPRSSSKHTSSDHGALPPCPKSCQNMTRTWDTSATKNRRTAGVNTR